MRVTGSEGVERRQHRSASRRLRLLVGDVTVRRLLNQARGVDGLPPQDGALSLAQDCFSMGDVRTTDDIINEIASIRLVSSDARRGDRGEHVSTRKSWRSRRLRDLTPSS